MRPRRALVLSTTCLALVSSAVWLGVGRRADRPGRQAIYVAAAASLADVTERLAKEFELAGGRPVRLDFASSGLLRRKIRTGARLDAFLAASRWDMDLLEDSGLLAVETRRDVLRNTLVCIVPASSHLPIGSAKDLLGARVGRVAVGDPEHVPVGIYARQALMRTGVWPRLRDKLAPCVDARATLALVKTGTVHAGIVYRTDAMVCRAVKIAFAFPAASHDPIVYPACVLKRSRSPAAAAAFLDFLRSPRAAEVFTAAGFGLAGRQEK